MFIVSCLYHYYYFIRLFIFIFILSFWHSYKHLFSTERYILTLYKKFCNVYINVTKWIFLIINLISNRYQKVVYRKHGVQNLKNKEMKDSHADPHINAVLSNVFFLQFIGFYSELYQHGNAFRSWTTGPTNVKSRINSKEVGLL